MRKYFLIGSVVVLLGGAVRAAGQAPDSPAVKEAVKAEAISAEAVVAAAAPVGSEVAVADTIAVTLPEQGVPESVGSALSKLNIPIRINGGKTVESPLLTSSISGAILGGAGHLAGGTAAGLMMGMNPEDAFKQSLAGFWNSVLMGGMFSALTTTAYDLAHSLNPLNGKSLILPEDMVTAENLGLEGEVKRIKDGIKYDKYEQYEHDSFTFRNDRLDLPQKTGFFSRKVTYTEYYVSPSMITHHAGAQRIVVGSTGHWYYSPDHYHFF